MISLNHYLIVALLMFILGLIGIMKRQNLIMLFFSTEILLNAANVALVAISKFYENINGQIFAIFIIAVAASEMAVGLGLLILWYKKTGSIELDSLDNMALLLYHFIAICSTFKRHYSWNLCRQKKIICNRRDL